MTAALFVGVLARSNFAESLAWADRRFALAVEESNTGDPDSMGPAQERYDLLVRRFGPRWELSLRIARCMVQTGEYIRAARIYDSIEPARVPKEERREVSLLAKAADQLRRGAQVGDVVTRVSRIPGAPDGWMVVGWEMHRYRRAGTVDGGPIYSYTETPAIQAVRVDRAGKIVERGAKSTPKFWGSSTAFKVRARGVLLDGKAEPGAILQIDRSGIVVYRFRDGALNPIQSFWCHHWVSLVNVAPNRPLAIECGATGILNLCDYYLYTGSKFALANHLFAESFSEPSGSANNTDYLDLLERGIAATIAGRRVKALKLFRLAERLCVEIRYQQRHLDDRSPRNRAFFLDPEDAEIALRQVRARIRWLQRGDLGHSLLYRANEETLQVPVDRVAPFANRRPR